MKTMHRFYSWQKTDREDHTKDNLGLGLIQTLEGKNLFILTTKWHEFFYEGRASQKQTPP